MQLTNCTVLITPLKFILAITLSLLMANASAGGMYKWVDANGQVHYGDRLPTQAQEEEITGEISSFESAEVLKDDSGLAGFAEDAGSVVARKKVVMYSAVWCGVCKRARKWMTANGIAFNEFDIEQSTKGARDFKRLKGKGVPIILVGNKRLNGFSTNAFETAYYY
ncbi:MAG: DUF4124 domain-containing protein [Pseudomonadota bacterium]